MRPRSRPAGSYLDRLLRRAGRGMPSGHAGVPRPEPTGGGPRQTV